jgi:hypothetical protein
MQEVLDDNEPLEDFVKRCKTRNVKLERRFKAMMTLAHKCNVNYVVDATFKPDELDYLRRIPGLSVTKNKSQKGLPGRRAWRISW